MSPETNSAAGLANRGRLAFLLRDSGIYGLAAALSKAVSLITFPVLAKTLTVEEFGAFDYLLILASLFTTIFVFGQDSAVARYFYEYEDKDCRQQLISQSLSFQLLVLLLFLPVILFLTAQITNGISTIDEVKEAFAIVVLQLPFLLIINFSQNLLKWTFQRAKFLILSIGFAISHASVLVTVIVFFQAGILEAMLVGLVTGMLFGTLGLFFVREWLARPRGIGLLIEMLPFAIPYGVICVAAAFVPSLERSITASMLGAEALGIYAVAAKLAMLIALITSAFQTAWGPFSLSIYKQPYAGYTFNCVFKIISIVMCVICLFLALLAQPLITVLATERYLMAKVIVFPLAMGLGIQAMSWITEVGIGISKRSYLAIYPYMASILVTYICMNLLVPVLGLIGVGLSVLLSYVFRAIMASWLAQRVYPICWQYLPVVVLVAMTVIGGLLSLWTGQHLGPVSANLVLAVTIFLVLVIGWMVLLTQEERAQVRTLLRSQRF